MACPGISKGRERKFFELKKSIKPCLFIPKTWVLYSNIPNEKCFHFFVFSNFRKRLDPPGYNKS